MKTAQRILSVALTLFNEHGEASVSSVDIANECDISPGNLYYHFKGKEQLVKGLMVLHRAQMDDLLNAKKVLSLDIDEFFYYLYLLIQRIHLFRFLYRSPADLMEKYPEHNIQHSRFLDKLESTLKVLFQHCADKHQFTLEYSSVQQISELTSLIITQSCQYDHMMNVKRKHNRKDADEYQQYHALSLLITALKPRCNLSDDGISVLQRALDAHDFPTLSDDAWLNGE